MPPFVNVAPVRAISALSKASVILRKLVKVPGNVGTVAPAFIFLKFTSRILLRVPDRVGTETPKLFASGNKMSEEAVVNDIVVIPPVAVIAPVCVRVPPELIVRFCPIVDVSRTNATLLVTAISFAPELLKLTAPTNVLF